MKHSISEICRTYNSIYGTSRSKLL
uniref:Uncharacterized protein n=1 Tax=Arundo donax TaxID=35708 RepID=A0A0A9ALN0_ARUDO